MWPTASGTARDRVELGAEVTELDLGAGAAGDGEGRIYGGATCSATGATWSTTFPNDRGRRPHLVWLIADSGKLRRPRRRIPGRDHRSTTIGCEAAASLAMLGAEVRMASAEQVLPQLERLGEEVAARIAAWL
ncbi:MAG: hypothetical protein U0R71_12050 [Solirubrobacterales bacterium]